MARTPIMRAGFTLVELMVVVVIIGLIGGVAVVSLVEIGRAHV